MQDNAKTKAAVSVTEMARMVGLSRARFYQLQRSGVFPPPVYDVTTRRPLYTEEQQQTCLEVRRKNRGINGQPLLFYSQRNARSAAAPTGQKRNRSRQKTVAKSTGTNARIVEGLKALGLSDPKPAQVEAAVQELFPEGAANVNDSEVIRAVFLYLQRRDSADNVG